jgi:D-arabinonate dehydratase
MKIVDVTTTVLHYPHVAAVQDGTLRAGQESGRGQLFVHISTDEGVEGLGVGVSSPGVRQVIESGLKEVLLDQDPFDIERLWSDMYWRLRSYGNKGIGICALSAVDTGLWDLKAKALDLPLYRLLGAYTDTVPIYGSGGWTNLSEDELLAEMNGYVAQGIPRVKMKVAKDFGESEREDIERVMAVRKSLGDDVALYVDANYGYYPKQAIYMAREFEQLQVGWLEEPVLTDDASGMAEVRHSTSIPIAGGELDSGKYRFRELIAGGALDIAQPDVGRIGGVTEWMKVAHLAHSFNLKVASHAFQAVHLHLACATPNLKVVEYLGVVHECETAWYTEIPAHRDGMWSPFPDKPGLGLELDPYAVEKWSV